MSFVKLKISASKESYTKSLVKVFGVISGGIGAGRAKSICSISPHIFIKSLYE